MKATFIAGAILAVMATGCEQESQPLPFSPDSEESIVRSLSPAEGGTVTSPAGAMVRFLAGSLPQPTEVSLTPVAAPAEAAASGSSVSRGFQLTPEALELDEAAIVEMRVDAELESARLWLASLVVVTAEGVAEIGDTRLDLRAGLAEAPIDRLGTLALVIPEPSAVFVTARGGIDASLSAIPSTLFPTGTDSVAIACGQLGARCEELSVSTSDNLAEKVTQTAAVYPQVSGRLVFEGSRASGKIELTSPIRLLLSSGATAENVTVNGLLRPTDATIVTEDASAITLTNVFVQVTGDVSSEAAPGAYRTIVIRKSGHAGYVTLSRTFELQDESGQIEDASVAITFPVQIHQ